MSLGQFAVGSLVFAGTWGAAIALAALIVWRRLPRIGGAPRVLAFATLTTAALIAFHLIPGLLTVMNRWTVLAVGAAAFAAAYRWLPRVPGAPHDDTPPAAWDTGPVSWGIAALAAAITVIWGVAQLWVVSAEPSLDVDTLAFQLPIIGAWMESGSLWGVHNFVPLQPHGSYPHNGDVVLLSTVQSFESDFLVRLVGAPFVLVAGLAAYAIARELRAPRATAALAAVAFCAIPAVARTAYLGAKPDPVMLATFGTGVLFALRHLRVGRTADLVLGGLSLGICFGTKWYAIPDVAIVVAVWAGAALVQRRGRDFVLKGGAILAGLIAVAGGFWFLRNAIGTGNPLYPLATPGLGDVPTDFYRDCVGYSIAYYLTDTDVLKDSIWPGLRSGLGFGGVMLFAGWLGAMILGIRDAARRTAPTTATDARSAGKAARRRQRRAGAAVATVAAMSGILGLGYVLTPYTALGLDGVPTAVAGQARYATPALLLAAPLLAWAAGRLGKLRIGVELLILFAVIDGVGRAFDVTAGNLVVAVFALAAASAAGYVIYLARHRTRILVPIAAATTLAVFAVADFRQHRFEDGRYETDAVISYLSREAPSSARIALAGGPPSAEVAPAWPAFGKRIDRTVDYLGHDVNGQLREYDDESSWRTAIERGDYDLLVVGRGGYAPECRLPGAETDDDAWARNAGFPVVARTGRQTVYRIERAN